MSSTDPASAEAAVRNFFEQRLMPLARRMAADGNLFFPLRPDPSLISYYKDRTQKVMKKEDFEVRACEGFEDFARGMAEMWSARGHEELAALAPELAGLARQLHLVEEQTEEVSPFIYVMF